MKLTKLISVYKEDIMKNNIIYFIIFILFSFVLFVWCLQENRTNDLGFITLLFAIISALLAIRQFKLNVTLNKLNALTINPESSKYIVRINNYLNKIYQTNQNKLKVSKEDIEKDNDLNISVNFILGFFDDIAIGIKRGIISERLTKEITGTYILKLIRGFMPYLHELDNLYKDKHYTNLLWLYSKWQ